MRRAVSALIAILMVACGSQQVASPSSTHRSSSEPPEFTFGAGPTGPVTQAVVTDITDGDTIRVEIDGTEYKLRYIGMDTPEVGEPGAKAATKANRQLVEGKTVLLEKDVSDTDRFDRLLRYVWLERGGGYLLINRELVRLGVATAKAYLPDTKYQDLLTAAQRRAKANGLGMWSSGPVPFTPPIGTPKPSRKPGGGGGGGSCDPSYPGVCIPPYPPDLDCGDIEFRQFAVRPPDPHGFDSDLDGIGCETL